MFEQVAEVVRRYEELSDLLASPEVAQDPARIRIYGQEQAEIADLVQIYRQYTRWVTDLQNTRQMLSEEHDEEMLAMISEEIAGLEARLPAVEEELKRLLLPKDPRDERNVIVEIRAGTGGDEAALFAADLFHMYTLYAAKRRWQAQVLNTSETGIGGYKEITFEIKGKGAYSQMKWESGVHRVQRVPATEASGRIHTSTATVAVLPEVDDVEVKVSEKDLRVDLFRAGGHGGQGVNTTDSAVRIVHKPTGLQVRCIESRSQRQNRERALEILRAKLFELEQAKRSSAVGSARREQIKSGERSERIRTYNFPQSRVTDHRLAGEDKNYPLERVLAGDLDEILAALEAQAAAAEAEEDGH